LNETQPIKTKERSRTLVKIIDKWIQDYKETHPCADCGHYFKYWQMSFDHLPGMVKRFSISKYKDHTKDINEVVAEVAKCEPVCHNCHSTRTHLRSNHDPDMHGVYVDELD
jgi:hypothetical protein